MSLNLTSYSKIYNLGHRAIENLFKDDVTIEEKVDGSQLGFGLIGGELMARSRGAKLYFENPEKMFANGLEIIKSLDDILHEDWIYRGEYLDKPKHNTICYDRVPSNYTIIFDIDRGGQNYLTYKEKKTEAERIGLECVPLLYSGKVDSAEQLQKYLETDSVLGGNKVEGIVIKNYERFTTDAKSMMGKFVSEKFKEKHNKEWKNNSNKKDFINVLCENYKTEARWNKSIQHLREDGKLLNEPKDIGLLMKAIQEDILEECKEEIKESLFKWAWPQISKITIRGFADFYKEKCMVSHFEQGKQ